MSTTVKLWFLGFASGEEALRWNTRKFKVILNKSWGKTKANKNLFAHKTIARANIKIEKTPTAVALGALWAILKFYFHKTAACIWTTFTIPSLSFLLRYSLMLAHFYASLLSSAQFPIALYAQFSVSITAFLLLNHIAPFPVCTSSHISWTPAFNRESKTRKTRLLCECMCAIVRVMIGSGVCNALSQVARAHILRESVLSRPGAGWRWRL